VTNGQFAKFVAAIQSEPPWGFADQETPVVHADHPVRWVNWLEATGYCRWAGKRLPTEAEWEKAARGPEGRRYPWGDEFRASRTNTNHKIGTTSRVDAHPEGASPYGVHDMSGNVFQWTQDWYAKTFYSQSSSRNPTGPATG